MPKSEWYTPVKYIEAAKNVMGDIDLDPASSDIANEVIGAKTYFTLDNDGLTQEWFGRVFMSPANGRGISGKFIDKIVEEFTANRVSEAIILVNNSTDTKWFQKLFGVSSAIIFHKGRIKFWMPNGKKGLPIQGQAFLYLGDNPRKFVDVFEEFGWAYVPV